MDYIYATLLLNEAKKEVNEANVKKVLDSVGVKAEASKLKVLLAALEGVDIKDVISKSASMSVAAAAPSAEAPKAEEKEEEEEVSQEEAAAGLGALFGKRENYF